MTEADFSRIESKLGIQLPSAYRRVMAKEGPKLLELARDYRREIDSLEAVFLTAEHLIEHNLSERPRDAGTGYAFPKWWKTYVMVGTNGGGDFYCLRLDGKPGVWMIGSDCGDEPTRTARTFAEHVKRRINWYQEQMKNAKNVVSLACLSLKNWQALKQALPTLKDLGKDYWEYQKAEDGRFLRLTRAGKEPSRVVINAEEFLQWCTANKRAPNAANREKFAAEKLQEGQPWLGKNRR